MLAELTTYLHALNGTTAGVRPTDNPEIGDLAELATRSKRCPSPLVHTTACTGVAGSALLEPAPAARQLMLSVLMSNCVEHTQLSGDV